MGVKNSLVAGVVAFAFVLLASVSGSLVSAAQAPKGMTLESIIQGAKREGRISWETSLEDHQVAELNKAFQKEYPFIKKVEYSRLRGGEQTERAVTEMQAGIFRFSVKNVQDEIISRFRELGFLVPIDWQGLFGVDPRMVHPDRIGVAVGNNPAGIAYNKNKVPKDRIPKRWEDCYDPYFKGKLAGDVRPIHMVSLTLGYGEEWVLDFAKKLLANNPRWMRGQTAANLLVASGELLISCPASHGAHYRQASVKPDYPVGWVFPEGPIVSQHSNLLSPMKGAPNFNAAVLLTGWIASKGVAHLDTGRESIFHPGTKLGAEFKRMNREIKVWSWDMVAQAEQRMQKVLKVWGFPRPSK